jgi:hypothetical protein
MAEMANPVRAAYYKKSKAAASGADFHHSNANNVHEDNLYDKQSPTQPGIGYQLGFKLCIFLTQYETTPFTEKTTNISK